MEGTRPGLRLHCRHTDGATQRHREWHAARARAGLPWLRLHDLRHACATFLLASGASPRTVMKTLGHSQISLMMNTYAHVLVDVERTAVDSAAERLFGPDRTG